MRTLNQKGFSLPELIVSMGLLGGISIITMKFIEEQRNNEAYLRARTEIGKAISHVKTALGDQNNCRSMLAGMNPTTTPTPMTQLAYALKGGGTKVFLTVPATYQGFKTDSMNLSIPDTAAPSTVQLEINFRIRNRNMKLWGYLGANTVDDRIIRERLPILVTKNAAGVITDCGMVVSEANLEAKRKICNTIAGGIVGAGAVTEWINEDPPAQTGPLFGDDPRADYCRFKDLRCNYGEVLTKYTNGLKGRGCQRIENTIDMRTLFDEGYRCVNAGNTFSITYSTVNKKLRVCCPPAPCPP